MTHTALVVDDDQQMLDLMEHVLRPTGIQTIHAKNGSAALDILKHTVPSVLFLDMIMPHVNGLEVLEAVRRDDRLKDMRVIVVSAHDHFELEQCEQLERADIYLVKPVFAKDVRKTVLDLTKPLQ